MQRPQGITAHTGDAFSDGEVAQRLSTALKRLATLRATIHSDWSDGPASLLGVVNTDDAAVEIDCWVDEAPHGVPVLDPEELAPPQAADEPALLRGRFETTDDTAPLGRVDVTFHDLMIEDALRAHISETDESTVASACADDREALAARSVTGPGVVEIEDIEPAFGVGALAGVGACVVFVEDSAPAPVVVALTPEDDSPLDVPCAPYGLHALLALTESVADVAPPPVATVTFEEDTTPELAVGAFALVFHDLTEEAPVVSPVTAPPEEVVVEIDVAFGAAPALAALFDLAPPEELVAPVVRLFDPMSLVDDAIADAFDALVCAPEPIDPYDTAWTPDSYVAGDHMPAAQLAACETHLWALPRHIPCVETFLATPNHETAVRITRALRVRANVLEARAFADPAAFGFLRTKADAQAFWFLADALHDATSLSAGDADADASFADWRMSDEGLVVVTVPDNAHPKRPAPLISEAELDALFAHVDDAQSRVVLDDLGDDPAWNDTFWCDVDSYLETVSETMDPAHTNDDHAGGGNPFDSHDIEVRAAPAPAPVTTFFWMPGDEFDLVVDGDGADLFIVGANDTAAVILVEDGASHAMRTGSPARMDEIVVSQSFNAWRDIDSMRWERVATLTGVAQVRVEQNAAASRVAVLAGSFFATTLEDDGVRLVLSGDEGDVDYPVVRVGGVSLDADWPFGATRAPTGDTVLV